VKYKIIFTTAAKKDLDGIPKSDISKIVKRTEKLALDPFPNGYESVKGSENTYRIRQGDYRILYTLFEKTLIILVLKIGHRREVYRDY
jgi:mRNA interferase RelE/StbE